MKTSPWPITNIVDMISQLRENLTHLNNSSVSSHENFLSQEERAALTVILALMGVLGFLGNAIVVYIIASRKSYVDVPANIFILSQAFADLATALSIPVYIFHMYIWNWGAIYVILTFVWISSLGSLFLLTFNRLLSVADSLKYPRRMTPYRAKILVVIIWIAALLIALLHMIGFLIHSDGNFFNYGRYYIIALITGVIFSNAYMFRQSQKQARKIKLENRPMDGLQRNLKEDLRSVKTLALVGGTFLFSCLPLTLFVFVYGNEKESVRFQRLTALVGPLSWLNPVLDPVIYFYRSSEFRSFYQRFKRLHGQNTKHAPGSLSNINRVQIK